MRPSLPLGPLLLALALALGAGACSKHIGDDCKVNVDCSINGDRQCDTAQPGGYCTVEGCDEKSCPDDAHCVRFFSTKYLDRTCDFRTEGEASYACRAEEVCLQDNLCAPRDTERRFCVAGCGDNGDCRDGYVCRKTGTGGAFRLPSQQGSEVGFCSPR